MTYVDMTKTEYQRLYRARTGGGSPSDKARSAANTAAAKWVLHNMPELYGDFLVQARAKLGLPTEIGPKGNFTKPIDHGTTRGYGQHRYRGEPACRACKKATADARRERRSRP